MTGEEGGEVLPGKRLMRMCTCMGLHSHDWIHHNGVTFSMKLQEWCSTLRYLRDKNVLVCRDFKMGRFAVTKLLHLSKSD